MPSQRIEVEDKGKVQAQKKAQESTPQHQDGPFAANLQMGGLDAGSVGRLQQTIGNKATRQLIQRQSALEDKLGGSAMSKSQIPKSTGDEAGSVGGVKSMSSAGAAQFPSPQKTVFKGMSSSAPQSAQGSGMMGGTTMKVDSPGAAMGGHLTPGPLTPFPGPGGGDVKMGDGQSSKLSDAANLKTGGSDYQEDKTA